MVNIAIFRKWITENISALEIELSKSPLKVNKYQKIYSGKLFVYTRLNHIDYKLEDIEEIERTVQQDQMTFPKENRRDKWVYYGIITACEDAKIMLKVLS
jgi:hypothetical protein